jgi:hypothetical protein
MRGRITPIQATTLKTLNKLAADTVEAASRSRKRQGERLLVGEVRDRPWTV